MNDFYDLLSIALQARNEWDKLIEPLNARQAEILERQADVLCIVLAELSTYLTERKTSGCGDAGHDKALGEAIKTRKKIRKALGYAYP